MEEIQDREYFVGSQRMLGEFKFVEFFLFAVEDVPFLDVMGFVE